MNLSTKETGLLSELKGQEELCIEKYSKYAAEASDPQLQSLFSGIAAMERQHLNTLTSIENGSTGSTGGGSGVSLPQTFKKAGSDTDCEADKYLCSDLLSTEKHASHLYDTCIFEFKDENVRQTLNHIQKEEQTHGKLLYDYMQTNGMYAAQ